MASVVLILASACTASGTWAVTSPPTKGGRVIGPSLRKVSCSTPTMCVALGTATVTSGPSTSTQEGMMAWNGTVWRNIAPSGVDAYSIDCFATGCLALGQGGKSIWNGSTWTVTVGAGAFVDACADIVNCYQVAFIDDLGHQALSHWNGTTSTPVNDPRASTRILTEVDCPVAGTCSFATSWDFGDPFVMERWDHGAWTVEPLDGTFFPTDITCPSASACVAVGAGPTGPAAAVRAGSSWHVVNITGPSGLDAVDCTSATSCVAFGDPQFAVTYNGTTWTATPPTGPAPAFQDFAVGCASASTCFVVGGSEGLGSPTTPFIQRWNGSAWSDPPVAGDAVSNAGFDDVSCATVSDCLAVGTYEDGASTKLLAERWDGSQWTTLPDVPVPPGAIVDVWSLPVVDCPAVGSCLAAVSIRVAGADTAAAARWDGSAWHTTPLAAPPHAGPARAVDLSCATATSCVLVGDQTIGTPALRDQFAQRWNGTTWTAIASPSPSTNNQTPADIRPELSCPTPTFCMLANGWTSPNVTMGTTVELFDGTAWSLAPDLPPVGLLHVPPALLSIDCSSATSCVGTGFLPGGAAFVGWDGTAWHDESPFLAFVLATVSCAPGGRCLAVGTGTDQAQPGGDVSGYTRAGDGQSWSGTTAPGDPAARQITGVSCVPGTGSTTACLVVGRATTGVQAVPLALRHQF